MLKYGRIVYVGLPSPRSNSHDCPGTRDRLVTRAGGETNRHLAGVNKTCRQDQLATGSAFNCQLSTSYNIDSSQTDRYQLYILDVDFSRAAFCSLKYFVSFRKCHIKWWLRKSLVYLIKKGASIRQSDGRNLKIRILIVFLTQTLVTVWSELWVTQCIRELCTFSLFVSAPQLLSRLDIYYLLSKPNKYVC